MFFPLSLAFLLVASPPGLAAPVPMFVTAKPVDPFPFDTQGLQQLEAGDWSGAIRTYEELLRRGEQAEDPQAIATAQIGLAKAVLLSRDYRWAVRLWEQVISTEIAMEGRPSPLSFSNLALALFELGEYERAEGLLEGAIADWEALRNRETDLEQVTLFEQQAHTYRLWQKTLVAQGKFAEALVATEASRAQSLVEQLVRNYSQTAPPPLDLAGIQATARKENTTFVVYSLVGDEVRVLGTEANVPTTLYVWVIAPDGKLTFRTVDLAGVGIPSLREFVHSARAQVIGRRARSLPAVTLPGNTAPEYLYHLLIDPIADQLPTDPLATVTFIPQDALLLVPFAALRNSQGNYLIDRHTVRVAPAIQTLALTRPPRTHFGPAVIVGNPTMPELPEQGILADLPGAEAEAVDVAALLNVTPFLGAGASWRAIAPQIESASILHFATHGLLTLDSQLNAYGEVLGEAQPTARQGNVFVNPGAVLIGPNVLINGVPAGIALARERVVNVDLPGALALAPSPGHDGFLTSRAIAGLNLQADLVVLSACDTGQGRITGDGVVGLSRAFLTAGANTVVVSLWAIPDAPTAVLMTAFYRQLRQNPDKAQALRQAMLITRQQYPNPVDWAGFILIGAS